MSKVTKITIEIDGKPVQLSIAEAVSIYLELDNLFGRKSPDPSPPPIQPIPMPEYPRPEDWILTCRTFCD